MNFCRDTQPDIDLDVPHWIRDHLIDEFHEKHPSKVLVLVTKLCTNLRVYERGIRKFGHRKFLPKNYKLEDIYPDPYVRKDVKHYVNLY